MKIAAIGLAGLGIVCAGVWAVALVVKNNSPVATSVVPSPVPTTQATGSGSGSAFDETSKETCGDPPDASATWYAVFIDGGNLNEVHRRFCKDAIAVNRQDSGKASIQVASFSDRARAEAFARSVNGESARYEPKVGKNKVVEAETANQKPTSEHMLATLDGGMFTESKYSSVLDHLESRCVENREKLASMAYGAAKESKSRGKNISAFEMLNAVGRVTEPLAGTGRHKCEDFYITLVISLTAQ
ncbi:MULTISPECIES: hypothetical protein [Leptolyngbya]|uniref:hypothetical protein n=1 Tax=Leptolyngbya TaxID=47251 RepID=UPI0016891DE1|nr:hypothetical protein [Leptolyngbya sp. FACHB-1624]MBD1858595.1 hypothetical protein [Leptolyngbya sp. FACHB-1624]